MASGAITKFSKFGGVLSQLNKVKHKVRFYYTYAEEPGQPMQKEPCFTTADEAVKCIKSGQLVFVHSASATPLELVRAMTDHGKSSRLKDVRVSHILTAGTAPYTDPSCDGIFRSLNFFTGANARQAVADGRGDYVPIFVSDIPLLFYRNIMKPDVSLINVSPPDAHGFCSLGTCVDCVRAALIKSKIIIAQINPCVPRTFGDALIHQSHIDFAVPVNSPIPEFLDSAPADIEAKIGKLIAENLVEDGSTLQMGVGSIPDSVLSSLHNHKDLGIHSEMFSTGVVDLVEKGCVSNSKKTLHKGRIVASFLLGSKKLYDFVDNNPSIELLRIEYVNNPHIIAQQPKMTAINSCIEVDLTGQIVADSIGAKIYSGFGGQVEFIRGAAQGIDGKGKPIIALSSTTSNGESKITPFIKNGAGVVTTRAHVHYVVTEYGIANLFGKSLRQRAHALINISHPDHREKLEKAAFDRLKCMPSV